jgi:citrate lyase beta subunit
MRTCNIQNTEVMITSFDPPSISALLERLEEANKAFRQLYTAESPVRHHVHTVYGGAHLFTSDVVAKASSLALRALQEYAPDFVTFARALELQGSARLPRRPIQVLDLTKKLKKPTRGFIAGHRAAWIARAIYERVLLKLKREPIEDYRIDFEDGYGVRSDSDEDGHAAAAAEEVANGLRERILPPAIGIRIKPLTDEFKTRAIRTLDIFVSTLVERTVGKLPDNFVVTLPKVTIPAQVTTLVELFEILEAKLPIRPGSLKLELMIETPQSIINRYGEFGVPLLINASRGRCAAVHFGPYDYTASLGIAGTHQTIEHPACDFARHLIAVGLAGTGIAIADGPTHTMPIGPHRPKGARSRLTARQERENRELVHRAWRLAFQNITRSLTQGYYRGWDLHPAQLPVRYAAVYAFFLDDLDVVTARFKNLLNQLALGTMTREVFDDAATGRGLFNHFLRGWDCGAFTESELREAGLTPDDIKLRSLAKVIETRSSVR